MKKIGLFALMILGLTQQLWADPHHQGTLSSINLGIRYSSVLENRGIIFYRDFQIDPVVAVFLFDDRLEYLGDSIGYRDFVYEKTVRLRTRLVSISDNPLFPSYDSVKTNNPDRPDTFEWNTRAEIFFPAYNDNYVGELDIGYSKDISIHHGNYFEIQGKLKLFDFRLPKLNNLIEPNLSVAVGAGDEDHNRYFYGPQAGGFGANHLAYGLWFAFPESADRFYPIIQVTHFEVLGDANRNAQFASGRNEGWLLSFIATGGILE